MIWFSPKMINRWALKSPTNFIPGFEIGKKNMKSKTDPRVSYFDKSFVKLASFHLLERFFSKRKFYILFFYTFLLYILLAKKTLDGRECVPVQSTSFSQRNDS